ncbi:heavy-metal-associated domain-containing protein [Novosphingobium sp. KCTC 2891]|uniref:heavy-metal-associated domain-containing protein n=1 Tax=Novosphingobium sp. KCTC 2891 TaxID=2989730 RepID=UPI0022225BE6|nr:heavy-metal-associated domain-containing protein [Novosphingobium sp. KCTC 2891]MCW1384003.1 heavy-metal-associated domain-containing protein [Novosphingobium sp. KCTC 2891]
MAVLRLPNRLKLNRKALLALGGTLALGLAGAALYAQIEGDRGIPPIASNGDFEVSGIEVNASGENAEAARAAGWKDAQRKAWEKLWASNGLGGGTAPALDAATLDGMVSAIVVENEQVGPHRYIATLGVIFDRARTSGYLGMQGQIVHSAPLLIIPVLYQGGVASVYETRTPWQKAWAEFRTGESVIDYVRPNGSGADSLLLTEGQLSRRSRNWWRLILDEFGAADVIMPIARLERQWPGGPVRGSFTARFGPDNRFLGSFEMTAQSEDKLPGMLAQAVKRLDGLYGQALAAGRLTPDATLNMQPVIDPKLIEEALAKMGPAAAAPAAGAAPAGAPAAAATAAAPVTSVTIQFSTPDAAAVDAGLSGVRAVAGVQGAATSSIAIGGTSVMRVTYAGDLDALAAALRAQGWKVTQGAGALSIRK